MLFFALTPMVRSVGDGKEHPNISPLVNSFVANSHQLKTYSAIGAFQRHSYGNSHAHRIAVTSSSGDDSVTQPPPQKKAEKKPERYKGTVGEFGRFARIVATALLVFLLLFFVDILAGLAALTIGSFYAIAVLFGVRGVETWGPTARNFIVQIAKSGAQQVKSAYRTVRQEVRKRLED